MPLAFEIECHRKPLLRIVAKLFVMIGLAEGHPMERLAAPLYRAVLRILKPAESAVRRLIVAAANGLVLKPPSPRTTAAKQASTGRIRAARSRTTFQLFDPRRRFASAFAGETSRSRIRLAPRPVPRVTVIDVTFDPRVLLFRNSPPPAPPPAPPAIADGTVGAIRLSRRLFAVRLALEDLPRQARRYARWLARPQDLRRPQLSSALRPGLPPGARKRPTHQVDEILDECDWLARHGPEPDSS